MDPNTPNVPPQQTRGAEKEWTGSVWKHPYMLYIFGTLILFAFLLLMGYLAIENDWIPKR